MVRERVRASLDLAVQICLFVFTAVPLPFLLFFVERPDDPVRIEVFRYYTTLSNVFAGIAAVPAAVSAAKRARGSERELPRPVLLFRFIVTSALTLTMMTVIFFLGPLFGYREVFSGTNLLWHLVNPILSILAFFFLEPEPPLKKRDVVSAVLPTALYGIVYTAMVVFVGRERGGWPDFYGFNRGGLWYVSVTILFLADVLIGALLLLARNRIGKRLHRTKK